MNLTSSGLGQFLSAFNELSIEDREKVSRPISFPVRGISTAHRLSAQAASNNGTHSCAHCRRLVVQYPELVDETPGFGVSLSCTKEGLARGLVNRCLLFTWIFQLLRQGLQELKSDLSGSNIHFRSGVPIIGGSFHDDIADLNYLQAQDALTVDVELKDGGARVTVAGLSILPFLLDQLWEIKIGLGIYSDYYSFIRRFCQWASLTAFRTQDDPAAEHLCDRPVNQSPHEILDRIRN